VDVAYSLILLSAGWILHFLLIDSGRCNNYPVEFTNQRPEEDLQRHRYNKSELLR